MLVEEVGFVVSPKTTLAWRMLSSLEEEEEEAL